MEGGESQGIYRGIKWRRACEKQEGLDLRAPMCYGNMKQ